VAVDVSGRQARSVFKGTQNNGFEAARAVRMIAKEPVLAIVNGKQQVLGCQFGFTFSLE
jgi:hypothetical protein